MTFIVTILPSGLTFRANEGESILDGALRKGINLRYGCRHAVCGACKGRLLAGTVEYDGFETPGLDPDERDMALFCRAIPTSDVSIEASYISHPDFITPRPMTMRVIGLDPLADDIICLQLQPDHDQRFTYHAGQYIDILLADGRRCSFSIANAPQPDNVIDCHIRKIEQADYTGNLFNQLQVNDSLQIEGPFGSFYFRENSTWPMIFMAGGTGFGPIKAIIEYIISAGIARPIHLYWGARTRKDLYLDELAKSWAQLTNLNYIPVLSQATAADHWTGRTGLVHDAVAADFTDLSHYDVYCCGPPPMISAGHRAFLARGLSAEHFYCDAFNSTPVET